MSKKIIIFIISIIIVVLAGTEFNLSSKLVHPRLYSDYVQKYSEAFELDENLVYSIIKVESKFHKNAESNKGAKGLMQISDITRDWAIDEMDLGEIDIKNPEINIMIGCWYLDKLIDQFKDIDLVIASYNAGSGNVSKWLKNKDYSIDGKILYNIPFEETKNYVKKVKRNYETYTSLYK